MFRIIWNEKGRAAEWIWSRIPGIKERVDWGRFSSLIHQKNGDICAVVIYNNWNPETAIEMHVAAAAGEQWLTRPFLAAAFGYPFIQLGVRRVTACIAGDNAPVKRFIEHLGFKHEGTARKGWNAEGVDCLIYGMLKSECRFIRHG